MKYINVTFTDAEMKRLKKIKGHLSWRDFILNFAKSVEDKEL